MSLLLLEAVSCLGIVEWCGKKGEIDSDRDQPIVAGKFFSLM